MRQLLEGRHVAVPAPLGRTRSQICAEAGRQSQRKRKERVSLEEDKRAADASASVPVVGPDDLAVVPWCDFSDDAGSLSLLRNRNAQKKICEWTPGKSGEALDTRVENGVLRETLALMSKSELAKKLNISRQTVVRRTRLLALALLLVRRRWASAQISGITDALVTKFGRHNVLEKDFFLKYKYDEMSMRVRAQAGGSDEVAVCKLVQIIVVWVAIWKVQDRFLRYRKEIPTTIRSVEACTIDNMRHCTDQQVLMPECADAFAVKTRLPVADKHASNTAVDLSYLRDFPNERMLKFNCQAHHEHKIYDRIMDVFPNERRGLLHLALSMNFGGTLQLVKSTMKEEVRRTWRWVDCAGSSGPPASDIAHMDAVFKKTCDLSVVPKGAGRATLGIMFVRRKRLVHGRLRFGNVTEHWCYSRTCCRNAEHGLQQFQHMIDNEVGLKLWATHRWKGVEDATDWVLFWTLAYDLLPRSIKIYYAKHRAGRHDTIVEIGLLALEDAEADDHCVGPSHLPEEDLGMVDPIKDESAEQRQATFRSNALMFADSKYCGRLWGFKQIITVQQTSMHRWIKHSGRKARMR